MKMNKVINILSICVLICIFSVSCKKNEYVNDGHEHTFSNKWTYDENFHWKKASCSGSWDCDVRIANKGAHTIGDWIPDTDLIKSSGKITEKKECSVCGMKETRVSEFPICEVIDSNKEGVKLKFYLPENTKQITISKAKGNGRDIYYSRMSSWNSSGFSEKEIEWTDPYVNDGETYYYYFYSSLKNGKNEEHSKWSDSIIVKSNGGEGEFKITNTPAGSFDIETKTFTFTTLPEYSIANAKPVLNFNSANNSWWYKIADNTFEIQVNYPFGNNTQVQVVSIGVQGNINSSWPYSGNGDLFYRSMEGGIVLDEKSFTWVKPE